MGSLLAGLPISKFGRSVYMNRKNTTSINVAPLKTKNIQLLAFGSCFLNDGFRL